jgi:hypothetical protein
MQIDFEHKKAVIQLMDAVKNYKRHAFSSKPTDKHLLNQLGNEIKEAHLSLELALENHNLEN